jgi:hypothetical protein
MFCGANCKQDELLAWLSTNVKPQQNKNRRCAFRTISSTGAYGDEALANLPNNSQSSRRAFLTR